MSDILDAIDATVDGLCACGCGRLLTSGGPSGWWATEGCQLRFQERGAIKPGQVRSRPDAADVGEDAAPMSLRAPYAPQEFRLIHNTYVTTYRYTELTPAEQDLLHRWLEMHEINPDDVPLDTTIRINGSWRVEVDVHERHPVGALNDAGEVARTVARRRLLAPWPLGADCCPPPPWTDAQRMVDEAFRAIAVEASSWFAMVARAIEATGEVELDGH